MSRSRRWADYSADYRADQVHQLAAWLGSGTSACIVGLGGAGKSNLLGYLAHRPDVLERHLPAGLNPILVWVDLNYLPTANLQDLYRLILRSLVDADAWLTPEARNQAVQSFANFRSCTDAFLVQTAILDLLREVLQPGTRMAIVMDRFDKFLDQQETTGITDALRALRDTFKGHLCYFLGMRQPVAYLPERELLGELTELIDAHTLWVGGMAPEDALGMIDVELGHVSEPPDATTRALLLSITGGYPSLVKAACGWWRDTGRKHSPDNWFTQLACEPAIVHRLEEIWDGLTIAEQAALGAIGRIIQLDAQGDESKKRLLAERRVQLDETQSEVLASLIEKRILGRDDSGYVVARLLLPEARRQIDIGDGVLRLDESTQRATRGGRMLTNLTNLEERTLIYLLHHARERLTMDQIVQDVWPDDSGAESMGDEPLYQVIRGIRKKIEPEPSRPSYLVTWRGRPKGGYQLFPEGRPRSA